jgi:hypothetical protein
MSEQFISTTEAGQKWGISGRRVAVLCAEGRVPGAMLVGGTWILPADTAKPGDARIKSGRYIKEKPEPKEARQ